MEAIGGKAVHQKFVIKNGSGYGAFLKTFNELLSRETIDSRNIAKEFKEVLLKEKYGSLEPYLDKFMKDKFKIGFDKFIEISQSK